MSKPMSMERKRKDIEDGNKDGVSDSKKQKLIILPLDKLTFETKKIDVFNTINDARAKYNIAIMPNINVLYENIIASLEPISDIPEKQKLLTIIKQLQTNYDMINENPIDPAIQNNIYILAKLIIENYKNIFNNKQIRNIERIEDVKKIIKKIKDFFSYDEKYIFKDFKNDIDKDIIPYFSNEYLYNIYKLNTSTFKIPQLNSDRNFGKIDPEIFLNCMKLLGWIIKLGNPNVEKYLKTEYSYIKADKNYSYSKDVVKNIISILITNILYPQFTKFIKDIKIPNFDIIFTKETFQIIILDVINYVEESLPPYKPTMPINVVVHDDKKKEALYNYFIREKAFNFSENVELDLNAFSYNLLKKMLLKITNNNDTFFKNLTLTQWINLMNYNNSWTNLFMDYDKRKDLTIRVKLIFKDMIIRNSKKLILFDGHGRTIFLLLQFMHVYNYFFDIEVYEITEFTHNWHEYFFPSLETKGYKIINKRENIQNLIDVPPESPVARPPENIRDTTLYLNFCGIDGLYELIFNFIKLYKKYCISHNFSLWISSVVGRFDVNYLYNINERIKSDKLWSNIGKSNKIAILLLISFISDGTRIGKSNNIPKELSENNLKDTINNIKIINNDINVDNDPYKVKFIPSILNKMDNPDERLINNLLQLKIRKDESSRSKREINNIFQKITNNNFASNVAINTPEQKFIVSRRTDIKLSLNQEDFSQPLISTALPNNGEAFITFKVDIHRLIDFEKKYLNLEDSVEWQDFFYNFCEKFGFVTKYFLKYLKYKQKYLNLKKSIE